MASVEIYDNSENTGLLEKIVALILDIFPDSHLELQKLSSHVPNIFIHMII